MIILIEKILDFHLKRIAINNEIPFAIGVFFFFLTNENIIICIFVIINNKSQNYLKLICKN